MGSTNCWKNRMGVIENKYNYQVFQKAFKTVAVKVSNKTVVEIENSLKQIFSQMGICILQLNNKYTMGSVSFI